MSFAVNKVFFLFCLLISTGAISQGVPVVHTDSTTVDIRDGKEFRKSSWNIDPRVRPDVYEVLVSGENKPVSFISDKDSIHFDVKPGKTYPFIFLVNGKDSAFTEVKGIREVPRATFTKEYIRSHTGKTFVEIPPVYELINVVFALTALGKQDNGMVIKHTSYYQELSGWFEQYSQEPIVLKMESVLKEEGSYHALKMDAYAFEFSKNGKIIQSEIYNRIGWANTNHLASYIPDLQAFAEKTRFQEFYKQHRPLYNRLITAYRDSIGVSEMQKWLTTNFPSTKYDSFKIIFSPLVGNNQSASWFEDNGFREAQAHVNFPYRKKEQLQSWSEDALLVRDGNIVFTEMNHSFINPEGEKPQYKNGITTAFANLGTWNDMTKPAKYYNNAYSSFNEHMNWGLVSLRYVDLAPKNEQDSLISLVEKQQTEYRGFKKFSEFNQFLVQIYKNRGQGQTVADLYPVIVKWFEQNK